MGFGSWRSYQIEQWEDDDPHQIDEVPIECCVGEIAVLGWAQSADQAGKGGNGKGHQPCHQMDAMQAGDEEVTRGPEVAVREGGLDGQLGLQRAIFSFCCLVRGPN